MSGMGCNVNLYLLVPLADEFHDYTIGRCIFIWTTDLNIYQYLQS